MLAVSQITRDLVANSEPVGPVASAVFIGCVVALVLAVVVIGLWLASRDS